MNKKILLTGWGFPPNIDGGLDIHVYHLFEELEKEDEFDVTLALPAENAPDRENVKPVETGDGDMTWKARNLSSEVAKIADDYDIVHTHDWFGAEAGFKASKYADTTWISTIHSLISSRTRGSSEDITKMEEVAVSEPDKVISVSEGLKNDIKEEFGSEASVIYNGFSQPSSTGKNVKKDLNIKDNMIFFVGRHAEQKGIEHLLYGFKKYLDNDGSATLVIGGDGHMRKSLEEFTQILGISEKVFFTGFIPSEELGDYYREADVFVSPSINEPFGLTITEALESGTPVLATDSGVNELVSTGAIFEISPDSDSIAEGIEKALKEDFIPEYESRSWSDMSEEIKEIYRELN
jgi:starch synthase